MGCVPFPTGAELNLRFSQDDQLVENTFAVDCGTAPDDSKLTALNNALLAWEAANYKPLRTANSFCTGVYSRDMQCPTARSVETNLSTPEAGTGDPAALPNNVTIAIKGQTGLAGRSFRSRTYIVGLQDIWLSLDRNGLAIAHTAVYVTAFTALITAISGVAGCTLCVASRRHNNADRGTGVLTPITSYAFADLDLDSQRRRLPGHNRHR